MPLQNAFINSYYFAFFQPVLVTLSSKTDPLWRDYEQQCLTSSDTSSGSTVAHIMAPTSCYNNSSNNSNEMVEDQMQILIKREDGVVTMADTTSITPPEFNTVFPDSSSSGKTSSTMWEDIASSIKKLDPDHADVLLEASHHHPPSTINVSSVVASSTSLPPVSTVVSGGDYYHAQYSTGSFSEQDLFNNTTRLNSHEPSTVVVAGSNSSTVLYSSTPTGFENSHQHPSTTTTSNLAESDMIQMLEFEYKSSGND